MGIAIGFGAGGAVVVGLVAGVALVVRWSKRRVRREIEKALRFASRTAGAGPRS